MNKYIIPVADFKAFDVTLYTITANGYKDCEEKLMKKLCEVYEDLPFGIHYTDFLEECDKLDIIIGEITDIETI